MFEESEKEAFIESDDALEPKGWHSNSIPMQHKNPQKNNRSSIYTLELEEKKKGIQEYDDDYEPYDHRTVAHPTTNVETLFHLLKGSLGTGILAMPMAFHNSGYVLGMIATIIIGLLCTYCMRILVTSMYDLCKRKKVGSMTYPATIEAALEEGPVCLRRFSKLSIHVTNTFLLIYQLGSCCVYVVFIANNLKRAFDSFLPDHVKIYMTDKIYMVLILLPLIFINWIKNLKFLVPCSKVATVATFVSFSIILYYIFKDPLSFDDREPIGKIENFPLYFGTVLFALEAIGVIMPLENEMKTPRHFTAPCGILNIGMGTIVILYAGMGFCGYIRYGSDIKGSITLNLSSTEALAKTVQLLLALAIYFTQPIQCYVAIDIVWNEYLSSRLEKNSYRKLWEYLVRTGLVLITALLAIAVPSLEYFISLFGALCLSALGLGFPAIIQLCTCWKDADRSTKAFMLIKNLVIVAIGVIGLVVGTYTSLREIFEKVILKSTN
ncbi:proton-coupled amino acid transporter-like protein CG1139 isoform X1 [Vespa velutina]|uniref:proton-coupled amino acid transporter-like protein CG1139 isoform X1 n=2 Tax=Vespa velutina TaxID=202808 RepID=UPI001FB48993|nr:proton-coupled amino acid transporter-like protein CG1139 isoform X1 [Vespa velutina]